MADMSDELVQWFGEQLDVDTARAQEAAAALGGHWSPQSLQRGRRAPRHYVGASTEASVSHSDSEILNGSAPVVLHAAVHDPAQVLREIDAKRAVLTAYAEVAENYGHDDVEYADGWVSALRFAVRQLATAYSDRPGYLDEWRP